MIFDFVKNLTVPGKNGKKFGGADKLYELCTDAEMNVMTNPDESMIKIRMALETLVRGLLMEDGNPAGKGRDDLIDLIKIYANSCDFIKNKQSEELDALRGMMNPYVHVRVTSKGEEEYEIKDKHAQVEFAKKRLKSFYVSLCKIFNIKNKNRRYIKDSDFPIGDYQIVQTLAAQQYESVKGGYKYVCKQNEGSTYDYFYVRPYAVEEGVFSVRDKETQAFLKNMKSSNHIITGSDIPVAYYCDVHYMAYSIHEDTRTLDQIVWELTPVELLDIIMQVSEGLADLITENISIYHRNIQPTCIFVTPFGNEFEAKLGCFETAKISYIDHKMGTVTEKELNRAQEHNTFVHEKLQGKPEGTTTKEWEAGDVYSLATILLYCINKNAKKENMKDCTILLNYFSDQFFDEMEQIICSDSLEAIPSMKDFYTLLSTELNTCD